MDARRFLVTFCAGLALLAALVVAALWIVDPYDRGHGWFRKAGSVEPGPRTANVSRGRDAQFNAAIIGNSHLQLLNPDRLNGLTGLSFVQLTVPATTPREQFVMLDWFMANHRSSAKTVVLGTDYFWCTPNPALPHDKPFPFWLYETDGLAYARGLFRLKSVQLIPRRLGLLLGRGKAQRADGFWDYEALRTRDETYFRNEVAALRKSGFWNDTGRFPAVDRLKVELAKLPSGVRVVLLVPPIFGEGLPDAGTPQAGAERACVAALQRIADARPGTFVVDARKDTPLVRDPMNFWDSTHYGRMIAEALEADIARSIAGK